MANTYTLISSVTVGSGGAATMGFTSIPSTYTDLVLKISARNTDSANNRQIRLQLNSSSSAQYSYRNLYGDGGGAASSTESSITSQFVALQPAATSTASTFGNTEIYFPNYAGSTNKSSSVDGVTENNGSEAYTNLVANLWANTSAISAIELQTNSGNFAQYSTAYLYGISNA